MIGSRNHNEASQFPYEVKVFHSSGPAYLQPSFDIVDWLQARGLMPDRHWKIDMRGGQDSYTSFYFKNANDAMITKLTHGGR